MAYALKTITFPAVVTATPLHDGTNGSSIPLYPTEFVISVAEGDAPAYIGDSQVADEDTGEVICPLEVKNFEAPMSRGAPDSWDARCIFYIGGPMKITFITKAEGND